MDISDHGHEVIMVPLHLPRMFLLPIANIRDQGDLSDQVSAYSRYEHEKPEEVLDKSCRECQSSHGNS